MVQSPLTLLFLVAVFPGTTGVSLLGAEPARPNVLLIVADDMGFSDPGCYGGEIETPNLDRLAAGGLRFTQFYNTARCWPSRAALLTGYYAQQVRRDTVPGIRSGSGGVRPPWARLLPEMLKGVGYRTYHSGKWHIDGPRLGAGFDHSYSLEDHNRNFSPRDHFEDDAKLPAVDPGSNYYTTTAIAEHAIKYLRAHAREHSNAPFFEYLCFTTPHFPLQAPQEDIARYATRYDDGWDIVRQRRWNRQKTMGLLSCSLPPREPDRIPPWNLKEEALQKRIGKGELGHAVAWDELTPAQKSFQARKMAIHAAMVDRMDREIGRVLDQVKNMGAWDNTLILFLSDNGASAEQIIRGDGHNTSGLPGSGSTFLCLGPGWSTAANTPLRLHKSWVHEGGISTPLILHWPAGIRAHGELRTNPSHLIDIVPTILELAAARAPVLWEGKPVPPPPGKSLVPLFAKDNTVSHEFLWWFHETNRAVRAGDWKLVTPSSTEAWELYNLQADRSEMTNLASTFPEKARQLDMLWQQKLAEFTALASTDLPPRARPERAAAREFGWAKESLPGWLNPFLGKSGLPLPWKKQPGDIGAAVGGIDYWQANHFVVYRAETADYLYKSYTPLKGSYVPGNLPRFEALAKRYTRGLSSDREKAVALVTRAMPAVIRHPTVPPCCKPIPTNRALFDQELLQTGAGYCNEQARIFVRLCQVTGIPARMVFLFYENFPRGHVVAEFYADGRWSMADTSWYCVFPDGDGHLMSAAELHPAFSSEAKWPAASAAPSKADAAYRRRIQELLQLPDVQLSATNGAAAREFLIKELNAPARMAVFGLMNYPMQENKKP